MQPQKCKTKLIEQVRLLIERGMSWQAISEVVGVHKSTLFNWRAPHSQEFKEDFVAMVAKAKENFGSTKTKQGQLIQSVKHTLLKITKERKVVRCPCMPPARFKKALLVRYADEQLELTLDPATTKDEMWYEMEVRVQELIEYGEPHYVVEDVIVKIEASEVDPSQPAVKNVLKNAGDPAKRWSFEEEVKIKPSDPFMELLAQIGGIKNVLPSQEPENES